MEVELHRIVSQIPKPISTEELFSTEDCTDSLEHFMQENRFPLDESDENYYWPTEIDPHEQEILSYVRENMEKVFPNVCKND